MSSEIWKRMKDILIVYVRRYGLEDTKDGFNAFLRRATPLLQAGDWYFGHLWQILWGIEKDRPIESMEGVPTAEELRTWIKTEFKGKNPFTEAKMKEYEILQDDESVLNWVWYFHVLEKKRVFENPLVEMYYKKLREHFLDYVTAFESLGICEADWMDLVDEPEFQEAYKRAKKIVTVQALSQMGKEGVEDGTKGKVDSFLKGMQEEKSEENSLMKELIGGDEDRIMKKPNSKKVFMEKTAEKDITIDSNGALESELEGTSPSQ